jgi:hypothetical protein
MEFTKTYHWKKHIYYYLLKLIFNYYYIINIFVFLYYSVIDINFEKSGILINNDY